MIDYLLPETLVSELVRPSPEAAQLLNVSAPVVAAATRVRVHPSGDLVMSPTDQAQQDEDANFRKIVVQLHVNLGHPSDDALARATRLSGESGDASPLLFPPLHSDVGQSLDSVWHLISSCLRTSLDKT